MAWSEARARVPILISTGAWVLLIAVCMTVLATRGREATAVQGDTSRERLSHWLQNLFGQRNVLDEAALADARLAMLVMAVGTVAFLVVVAFQLNQFLYDSRRSARRPARRRQP